MAIVMMAMRWWSWSWIFRRVAIRARIDSVRECKGDSGSFHLCVDLAPNSSL